MQGIVLHTVASNAFFYFETAEKEPIHPRRGMQTLLLLKPGSRDKGVLLWGKEGVWELKVEVADPS